MLILLLLVFLFLVVAACNWFFGLWHNLILLINIIIAGLVAASFYENLAFQLYLLEKSFVRLWFFLAQWILFAITFVVLRSFTDGLSGLRLRFDPATEMVGRSILSLLVAWTFVCFVSFTLQRAPLPTAWFPESRMGGGSRRLGPDAVWVNFVRSRSTGSLAYTAEETPFFPAFSRKTIINGQEVVYTTREFESADSYISDGSTLRSTIENSKYLRVPLQEGQ